ncbi:MAG: hypothetical protein ACP5I8_07355 [Phycisphaerae bacterium]
MEKSILGIFIWGGVLLVAVIIGWMVVRAIRRRLTNPPSEMIGFGFSLKQIEAMYKRGEITEEEYKALKRRKAEQAARAAEKYLAGPNRK